MKKRKNIIGIILLLFWMILIFMMSNQPGDVSQAQSDLVINFFNYIGIELNEYFGEIASLIVRKGAHFTEYMILFFLFRNVLKNYTNKNLNIYSILFVFLYAISDEVHQYFVPGREMRVLDVIIDTLGAVFGSLIVTIDKSIKKDKFSNKYLGCKMRSEF